MLNRMMFIYFIQKRGFLDSDPDYLRNRLERMQQEQGKDSFSAFTACSCCDCSMKVWDSRRLTVRQTWLRYLDKFPTQRWSVRRPRLERENPYIHIPDDALSESFFLRRLSMASRRSAPSQRQ